MFYVKMVEWSGEEKEEQEKEKEYYFSIDDNDSKFVSARKYIVLSIISRFYALKSIP
jgi:hypothetical protein